MSVRRSLILLTVLTLVIPAVVFGYRTNRPQQPASNIQEYTVQRGDVEVAVTAVGSVDADREASLSFSESGRIVEILVAEGDTVAEGDVLARLDDAPQQIALQQAALGVQLAQLQKDQLLAGSDEATIAVAEANVDSAMGAVNSIQNAVSPEQIQAAQLAYEQAQTMLNQAVLVAPFDGVIARNNLVEGEVPRPQTRRCF